jgi:multiple sugar transport system substrate-binding protein
MKRNRVSSIVALLLVLAVLATACGPTAAPAQPTTAPEPTSPPAPVVKDVVTWCQFDHTNTDPANDEAIGNAYVREAIPQFNAAFAGKWNLVNVYKAWDKKTAELVAAVQAGGDVPDIMHVAITEIPNLVRNGAVQDLTAWAQAQPWFGDLDSNAINACTGLDGKLYCIPVSEIPFVTFVWADHFPNGYPKTPEQFLADGERLKAEGVHIMTYAGSTDFNGTGATRAVWTLISGFGGTYDDGQGKMLLNTPENVAAIAFLRDVVAKGYVPEVAFAGGFQEEEAFKDASAASIPTGMYGYRYIRPLTAPNGNKYTKETEEDMLDAIEAGDVILAPFIAPEGKKPGCGLSVEGFVIPAGAKNVEGAYDYINWIVGTPEQNVDWVRRASAAFPALRTVWDDPAFQTKFYQQAGAVVEASACRHYAGSLERWEEAQPLIMNAVYRLVKEEPTADITTVLQQVQDEYNAN